MTANGVQIFRDTISRYGGLAVVELGHAPRAKAKQQYHHTTGDPRPF
ncbi:MAG: hypothetical protein CM1200mP29_07750 [Verrucomicrobiota bacterium]|nr:MAG: hypothetical protein CM1200mP29_07750 [Verrucomicrobiota bacterium]